MRILFRLILLLSTSCSMAQVGRAPANEPAPSIKLPQDWSLTWSDEFSTLNPARWKTLSRVRDGAIDDASAVRVGDGLKITTFTDAGKNFTGFVSSQGLFQTTYGYFEASINFHDSPGEWCAFWIQSPTNGNPIDDPEKAGVEIDITEHRFETASAVIKDKSSMGALHWDGYGKSHKDINSTLIGAANGLSLQGNFHTYGVLWSSAGYQFYLDGNLVSSDPPSTAPVSHASEFIYLSCEVRDKSWAGRIPIGGYGSLDSSQTGMDVAWVRVWGPK